MVKKDVPRCGSVNKPISQSNGDSRDSAPPPVGERSNEVPEKARPTLLGHH
jgi:hypothetical protein